MAQTTVMDVYVKGKIVFSYVRGKGSFCRDDIEIFVGEKNRGIEI